MLVNVKLVERACVKPGSTHRPTKRKGQRDGLDVGLLQHKTGAAQHLRWTVAKGAAGEAQLVLWNLGALKVLETQPKCGGAWRTVGGLLALAATEARLQMVFIVGNFQDLQLKESSSKDLKCSWAKRLSLEPSHSDRTNCSRLEGED